MKTIHHFKYIWILALVTLVFANGCGEPDIIVTDSTAESGDASIDQTETVVVTEQAEDPGVGGWWGVRHIKKAFSGDSQGNAYNNSEDPNNDPNIPFSATASEEPTNPDEVWMSEDKAVTDEEYATAKELVAQQQFIEAKDILQNIIQRHPDSSSAWRWLGDCYYNLLELPEAIKAYQKARSLYPENYFAMRGEGFAHLHYGNELWKVGDRRNAHDQYRQALRTLQECMRIYPGDAEALYGRSMAAEGASRRLYQNAITLLRADRKTEAESEAGICVEVIDEGIESARQRLLKNPDELGPIIITGGLFQRRAVLLMNFERYPLALNDVNKAIKAYEAVASISPGNQLAEKELAKCLKYQEEINKKIEENPSMF